MNHVKKKRIVRCYINISEKGKAFSFFFFRFANYSTVYDDLRLNNNRCDKILIHEALPIITVKIDHYFQTYCPSVSNFQNLAKQTNLNVKMIHTYWCDYQAATWIIDDSCLVSHCLHCIPARINERIMLLNWAREPSKPQGYIQQSWLPALHKFTCQIIDIWEIIK